MRRAVTKSKSWNLPLTAAAALMLATGCSGGPTPASDSAPIEPTSSYTPPQGAISDLTDLECQPDGHGVWSAEGIVSNSSKEQQTYAVTVAVIKAETSEVLGQKDFVVTLEPGKHRRIQASSIYKGEAQSGQCVPVVTLKP